MYTVTINEKIFTYQNKPLIVFNSECLVIQDELDHCRKFVFDNTLTLTITKTN